MLGSETVTRRGTTGHLAFAATAAVLVAAGLPAVASAKLVRPISVTGSTQSGSLKLKCPPRAVALNAASTSAHAADDSVPSPFARGWTLRFGAGGGSGVLRCVRLQLPAGVDGVSLAVETNIEPVSEVAPGALQTVAMKCSHGMVPTGWGLERAGADNGLSIAAAVPGAHGWTFTFENTGASGAAATLYTRCLERRQRAETGQVHTFSTRIAKSTVRGASATRSCRASEFSVATGVSLSPTADIRLTSTGPVGGRGGEWHFAQASGAPPVKTSLICLSTTTTFR
jgi:hypothetical protein